MAYHYMMNESDGEIRTIRSETLPRYARTNWTEFPSEQEARDFWNTPGREEMKFFAARYTALPFPPVIEIGGYDRAYYAVKGYRFFPTLAEAEAAKPATVWAVDRFNTREIIAGPGSEGLTVYASKTEAEASIPAMHYAQSLTSSLALNILASEYKQYEALDYRCGPSLEAVRAQFPPRFERHGTGYFRAQWDCTRDSHWRINQELIQMIRSCERIAGRYLGRQQIPAITVFNELVARSDNFKHRINKIVGRNACDACEICNEAMAYDSYGRAVRGRTYVCADCRADMGTCSSCSFANDNLEESENGHFYCPDHLPGRIEPEPGKLHDYTAKVTTRRDCFLKSPAEKDGDLWLGFELECFPRKPLTSAQSVEKVREAFGRHCICKADASVASGFEIVSVPATLQWHRDNSIPFLRNAGQWIEAWLWPGAGIHVHVGVKELSKLQIGRLLSFVTDPSNAAFLDIVAGRKPTEYSQRGAKHRIATHAGAMAEGRRAALNLESIAKHGTIEFRMFKANVAPLGFLKNLEFVHALCKWAKFAGNLEVAPKQGGIRGGTSCGISGAQFFTLWLGDHSGEYPALVRWMNENGLMQSRRIVEIASAVA